MANASNWLRLMFHSLTCLESQTAYEGQPTCVLGPDCVMAKQLLAHMACCTQPDTCPQCSSPRHLLLHYVGCVDDTCDICNCVAADLGPRTEWCRRGGAHVDCTPHDAYDAHQGACYSVSKADAAELAPKATSRCSDTASSGACSHDQDRSQLSLAVQHLTGLIYYALCRGAAVPGGTLQGQGDSTTRGALLWQHTLSCRGTASYSAERDGLDDHVHKCPVVSELCQLSKCLLLHRVSCDQPDCTLCGPVCHHFRRPPSPSGGSGVAAVQVEDLDLSFYASMLNALEVGIEGLRI